MSDNKKTIILMSRGMRLARFFIEAALKLSEYYNYNVIVLADQNEMLYWRNVKGIDVRNFDELIDEELDKEKTALELKVKEIEHEIKLSFFKSGSNYFLYRKFVKREGSRWPFYAINDTESMLRNYVGSYLIIKKIFEETPPSVIVYEASDLICCRVVHSFAYTKGVFALGMRFSPLVAGKIELTFGFSSKNVLLEYYYKNTNIISDESYQKARLLIDKVNNSFEPSPTLVFFIRRMKYPKKFVSKLLFVISQIPKIIIGPLTFRPLKFIKYTFNVLWLSKRCRFDLPKRPCIAFFLHHQPELTTCGQIPRWVNQELIIEQLAINAPIGIDIVVKEHPRTFGMRGRGYFKEILEMPNVFLLYPLVDIYKVIKNSEIILTLTGSVGLEAIIMGKKVAVLGNSYYSIYKGVKKLNYPEEIFDILDDPSWKPEDMKQERLAFVAAYIQSLYDFGVSKKGKLWPKTGGDKWAYAIRDFLKKKEEYSLSPTMFD